MYAINGITFGLELSGFQLSKFQTAICEWGIIVSFGLGTSYYKIQCSLIISHNGAILSRGYIEFYDSTNKQA